MTITLSPLFDRSFMTTPLLRITLEKFLQIWILIGVNPISVNESKISARSIQSNYLQCLKRSLIQNIT